MLDPESFMKNSPFQLSKAETYNLENTTPELLKFQLQEQSRASPTSNHLLQPSFIEASFNNHLQNLVDEKSVTVDDDNDKNDEFSRVDNSSGFSTPSSDISDSWTSLSGSSATNYMNLKILIENSVFDTAKMSPRSVLSLSKLKKLKQQLNSKTEQRDYLAEKFNISNQFCQTLLLNNKNSMASVDFDLLYKVYKQTADLQLQLTRASREIEELDSTLKSHYLTCLILGYIEDVKHTNISTGNLFGANDGSQIETKETQKAFDTLFSHIVSLAAQKGVSLPTYPEESDNESLQTKIAWATDCIDKVMESSSTIPSSATSRADYDTIPTSAEDSIVRDHSFLSASPYKAYKNDSNSKALSEYKLALNDLRFSHQYFMKEYEYLKENSLKTIAEYRKKNSILEKELKQKSTVPNSADVGQRGAIEMKNREISKLRKEVNMLKIECMGNQSPRNSKQLNTSLLSNLEDDKTAENLYSPLSPTMNTSGRPSMSNAILRKEFKKIVTDIQDQHEMELENERKRNAELQAKLDQLSL